MNTEIHATRITIRSTSIDISAYYECCVSSKIKNQRWYESPEEKDHHLTVTRFPVSNRSVPHSSDADIEAPLRSNQRMKSAMNLRNFIQIWLDAKP